MFWYLGRQSGPFRPFVGGVYACPTNGWDRARVEQEAGFRTFPIVAIASYGFVQTAKSVLGPGAITQANLMAGVITGVGFIGTDVIIRQGDIGIQKR